MLILTALALAQQPVPVCAEPPAKRHTCAVDSDTFWLNGVKYRLFGYDGPDKPGEGRCTPKKIAQHARGLNPSWCDLELYERGKQSLSELLSAGPIELTTHGYDQYGRVLVVVRVNGAEVGRQQYDRGLAREWRAR